MRLSYRQIALLAVAATVATASAVTSPASEPARGPCGGAALWADVAGELGDLFVTQDPEGALEFDASDRFYETYPLLATFALRSHRGRPDAAFLSRSAAAVARYYQHLFSTRDRNRNLMIETTVPGLDGSAVTVEDVGFNSLLALDMTSLAQLYLELRKPMRALYWYEGSRTLERTIVSRCYDEGASYFYPYDVHRDDFVRTKHTFSALPVLFTDFVGENLAGRLVSHYLLGTDRASGFPTMAEREISPDASPPSRDVAIAAKRLEAVMVADVLRETGFAKQAKAERSRAARAMAATTAGTQGSAAYLRLLACQLEQPDAAWLHERGAALEVLGAVIRGKKRRLADNEVVRVANAVATIRAALDSGPGDADPDRLQASVHDVYFAMSRTRDAARSGGFFDNRDRNELAGVSAESALERLLEDVTYLLQMAENEVFRLRHRGTGLHTTATLLADRAVAGEEMELRWSLATLVATAEVRHVVAHYGQQRDTLLAADEPVSIRPGEPLVLNSRVRLRDGVPGSLEPVTVTLSLTDGRGGRTQFHALRAVYVDHAVEIEARFPHGRVIAGISVPIEIHVRKRVERSVSLRSGWHSPAGLRLREGSISRLTVPAGVDTASARVHVVVPIPCRPGRFPFRLAFSSDEHDLGVIDANLFKPFQWLCIGPFAAGDNALRTPFPPERGFDLQKGYAGVGGRATWRILPSRAHLPDGNVSMREVLRKPGVAYLYTVVKSPYDLEVPVLLAGTAPAALFVNGKRVIDEASPIMNDPAYERVNLRRGLNDILVKIHGDQNAVVFFGLGDDRSLAPDDFNNNLWELVEGLNDVAELNRGGDGVDEQTRQIVTLRYVDDAANSVSVIGSFNGWSPEHSRMQKVSGDTWEVTLSLAPGKYTYRFLVNNRRQVLDPSAALTEPDGYGGRNSILFVEE